MSKPFVNNETSCSDVSAKPPSKDSWIPWKGGACPVDNGLRLDVLFEDGSFDLGILADSIDWSREGNEDDIVAYRVSCFTAVWKV